MRLPPFRIERWYEQYEFTTELMYADGWRHDLDELERLLRPDTRLVYVNTPHNPTGSGSGASARRRRSSG